MSQCCNPTTQPIEFPIIDKFEPIIPYEEECSCLTEEEICELKQKIICEYWDIIHKLNCGINIDLNFILQEISQVYINSLKGFGVEINYSTMKEFNNNDYFYIGAGITYQDALDNKRYLTTTSYDVVFNQNDRLFIIAPYEIVRADMNGFEIPFSKQHVQINNSDYIVYTSLNRYIQGTYNIDIVV